MATKNGRKLPKGIRWRNGKYEGRFTFEYQSYSVRGDTIGEVQAGIADLKYKLANGIIREVSKMTYGEWFDKWLKEYKEGEVKPGTIKTYKDLYNARIKEVFGNIQLVKIRGEQIQALYNKLYREGITKSSITVINAILHSSFKQAMKNGIIAHNPCEQASIPKNAKDMAHHIALTKEEQKAFMEYARKESHLYFMMLFMLRTGTRRGEASGLKYSDIDSKKRVIHIQRTLKDNGTEQTPKTKTSLRDIPLTPGMLEAIQGQQNYYSNKVTSFDGYIFTNYEGNPITRNMLNAEIKRIIKKMRAEGTEIREFTSHTFRDTFATRAIEEGMTPKTLQTILGHTTLAMTMDLYAHVMPDTKQEEMEKIAKAL